MPGIKRAKISAAMAGLGTDPMCQRDAGVVTRYSSSHPLACNNLQLPLCMTSGAKAENLRSRLGQQQQLVRLSLPKGSKKHRQVPEQVFTWKHTKQAMHAFLEKATKMQRHRRVNLWPPWCVCTNAPSAPSSKWWRLKSRDSGNVSWRP